MYNVVEHLIRGVNIMELAKIIPFLGAILAPIAAYFTYRDYGTTEAITVGFALFAFSIALYYWITKKDVS